MLRYFYIIVCIQVCFCSVYVDDNDYELLDRRIRCKTTKRHKKATRSPRRSQVVQFDVQKFMGTSDAQALDDTALYGYRSKKKLDRLLSANEAEFVEPHESTKGFNMRASPDKYQNQRHSNFHPHAVNDNGMKVPREHKKAMSSFKRNKLADNPSIDANPERKCSFKNMKIPFFSRNKAIVKTKRHKKRRIFCLNCIKKTTPTGAPSGTHFETPVIGTDDFNRDDPNIPSTDYKINTGVTIRNIRRRAYRHLCPRCIKELLLNLRKKTTPKDSHTGTTHSKPHPKTTTKKKTIKQRADLSDSLRERYCYVGNERLKRNEDEERERERRLKELEEVEKKIENVRIVAPTFTKNIH